MAYTKNAVRFEEASELFTSGVDFLEFFDEAHSVVEERFLAIGPIRTGVVLVIWTEVEENTVRIISARMANRRERALYYAHIEAR